MFFFKKEFDKKEEILSSNITYSDTIYQAVSECQFNFLLICMMLIAIHYRETSPLSFVISVSFYYLYQFILRKICIMMSKNLHYSTPTKHLDFFANAINY